MAIHKMCKTLKVTVTRWVEGDGAGEEMEQEYMRWLG